MRAVIIALAILIAAPAVAQEAGYDAYKGDYYRHHRHPWHDEEYHYRTHEGDHPPWAWHRRWRGCNPAMFAAGICDD
jgi:hypothetical protein